MTKTYKPAQIQEALKTAQILSRQQEYIILVMCYKSNKLYLMFESTMIRQFEFVVIEYINGHTNINQTKDKTFIERLATLEEINENRVRREFEKSLLK